MQVEKLDTPFPRSYWVIPGLLLAGELPGDKDSPKAEPKLRRLIDCGIRQILNLMEPDEIDHYGDLFNDYQPMVARIAAEKGIDIDCRRFPIADLNLPSVTLMGQILDAIIAAIEDQRPVYVHCWGGIGRTGTVIGCFLLQNGLAGPDNVLDVIAALRRNDPEKRKASPETPSQRQFVKTWLDNDDPAPTSLSRFTGCLLGGGVGDALGAPVEFMTRAEILRQFGPDGITAYARAYGGLGTITDDTQMTLFTAEGLLRGWLRGSHKGITSYTGTTGHAYLRWLHTQGERSLTHVDTSDQGAGWLLRHKALHSRRAPGNTCISALKSMTACDQPARNNSKGCGGVMRVAPVGLFHWRLKEHHTLEETFDLGADLAALTHGHPTGTLSSGVLAVMIRALCDGAPLTQALASARDLLRRKQYHEETLNAIDQARELATTTMPHTDAIAQLGQGWIAEEALAIAIYCALAAPDFKQAIILAVNHDGDTDSTGAITGNLLGAMHGAKVIPQEWLTPMELRDVITEVATDLWGFPHWRIGENSSEAALNTHLRQKYPGC